MEGLMKVNVGYVGDVRSGLAELPFSIPVFVRDPEGRLLRITELVYVTDDEDDLSVATSAIYFQAGEL
jgi:hypothetical protein